MRLLWLAQSGEGLASPFSGAAFWTAIRAFADLGLSPEGDAR